MPSNRNLDDIRRADEQVTAGQLEYDREFAALCRVLGITPAQLAGLPASVVVSLFDIRIFRILSLKLREIDLRLQQLEHAASQHPPAQPVQPPSPAATLEKDS